MIVEQIGVTVEAKMGMRMGRVALLHEVPLIKAFYGEDKVVVDPPALAHVKGVKMRNGKPVEISAVAEYQRLLKKYSPKERDDVNIVPQVFVSPQQMEEYVTSNSCGQIMPEVGDKVDGITDRQSIDKQKRRTEVMRALEERGVMFSKNTRTDKLEAKLRDILAAEHSGTEAA